MNMLAELGDFVTLPAQPDWGVGRTNGRYYDSLTRFWYYVVTWPDSSSTLEHMTHLIPHQKAE